MTQHPQLLVDVPSPPSGCTTQILLLLPPALFPDPSLVSSSAPGVLSSRSLSAPSVPNDLGWTHYEIEKAVGWSRSEGGNSGNKKLGSSTKHTDAYDDRSQLTEAERARIQLELQSRRGKVRAVTDRWESGGEFTVLASNEEDEEREEGERLRRIDEDGTETIRISSASTDEGRDAGAEFAQEYRALLLDVDPDLGSSTAQDSRQITLQLHARYLSARRSKASTSLLSSILSSPSSSSTANYAEIRYPSPRTLLKCTPSGARTALNSGAMEATRPALLPGRWSSFNLPVRSVAEGRILFPPGSRHSSWKSLTLPQPTTAHMDDVVRYTHLAGLVAAILLLVLTSRAADEVRRAVEATTKRRKSD